MVRSLHSVVCSFEPQKRPSDYSIDCNGSDHICTVVVNRHHLLSRTKFKHGGRNLINKRVKELRFFSD